MQQEKLLKLSPEERESKQREVCELMAAINKLDATRKQFLADMKDQRKGIQERVLVLLEDLQP